MFRPAWLLPHFLSLDAPVVALVWQAWWARAAGVALLPAHRAALGFAVWAIYLADRLADVRGPERPDTATARHRFSRRWRGALGFLLAVALGGLAGVTLLGSLPSADLRAGLGLAAVVGGYFAWVHLVRAVSGGWWKEAWVGAAFAVGTAVFLRDRLTMGGWIAVGLFGAVCFGNCALITRWETAAAGESPRAGAFLRPACGGIALLAAGLALVGPGVMVVPVAPVAFAAAGLRLLDGPVARGWSPEARRVLADAVLLTPLWWLLRG